MNRRRRSLACILALGAFSCSQSEDQAAAPDEASVRAQGFQGWKREGGAGHEIRLDELRGREAGAPTSTWELGEILLSADDASLYAQSGAWEADGALRLESEGRIRPLMRVGEWALQADRLSLASAQRLEAKGDARLRSKRLQMQAQTLELATGQADGAEAGSDLVLARGEVLFFADESEEDRPAAAEAVRGGAAGLRLRWFPARDEGAGGHYELELHGQAWMERGSRQLQAERILYKSRSRTLRLGEDLDGQAP